VTPIFPARSSLAQRGALLLALLFAAWLLPGLFGRDPWKADEAYSFGLVWHMAQSGDFVVPTLGGEPFMEKPPALFIPAALCVRFFSGLFEPHDAARLAVIFFHCLTFICLGLTARLIHGPGKGWIAPVLLIGAPGLLHTGHLMVTDDALICGFALALLGWAVSLRHPWSGGLLLGTGAGLSFMAKGLLGPGVLGLSALLLPVLSPAWRNTAYLKTLLAASLSALPWVILWPVALYLRDQALFNEWFWDQNWNRFSGAREKSDDKPFTFFFTKLLWYAFPAFPLMLWTLWKERWNSFRDAALAAPLTVFLVTLLVLSLAGQKREIYAMPLLIPLALLGARYAGEIPAALQRRGRIGTGILFGLFITILWIAWAGFWLKTPAALSEKILKLIPGNPGVDPLLSLFPVFVAVAATLAWLVYMIRFRPRPPATLWTDWAAGLALVYLLVMTIWLPVINANMSYKLTYLELGKKVRELQVNVPIGSENLGEPQRGMLDYYVGLTVVRSEKFPDAYDRCGYFLIQGNYQRDEYMNPPAQGRWELVWEGRRSGKESYRLYRKLPATQTLSLP
jgi:4-amino-4-deoxy-L-arabinose transferase-like glycosyltransferase